nr:immunoglobulin heavy chain junction region [Mus musculus]
YCARRRDYYGSPFDY